MRIDSKMGAPANQLGRVKLSDVRVPADAIRPGTFEKLGLGYAELAATAEIHWAGRRIGQDTHAILSELGGLNAVEIATLEADQIICSDPGTD